MCTLFIQIQINFIKLFILSTTSIIDFVIPKMNKVINYLISQDIDNDGLLEQDHNEDWMDSVMRKGKIVYSNTIYLALKNISKLLIYIKDYIDSSKGLLQSYTRQNEVD